jgi:hypothetical protein
MRYSLSQAISAAEAATDVEAATVNVTEAATMLRRRRGGNNDRAATVPR